MFILIPFLLCEDAQVSQVASDRDVGWTLQVSQLLGNAVVEKFHCFLGYILTTVLHKSKPLVLGALGLKLRDTYVLDVACSLKNLGQLV